VAQASGGGYQPNPKADRFDVRHVSPQKHVHVPALSNRSRRRAAPRDWPVGGRDVQVETVIAKINPERIWKTPGHTLGGGAAVAAGEAAVQLTADEVRQKRLEALSKRTG
jgi:hypothetical protein